MRERQRWQPEEDAILRAYVKQYGPKEWNLISQRMSKPLNRDPKSCLERWKNYLKPGIKKGSLTPEEQRLVISLQAKYGNKWKKIASEVPGRTAKRLGKWWEVFKEKQLKEKEKGNSVKTHLRRTSPDTRCAVSGNGSSPEGKYDHILETFAEKYVQVQPSMFFPIPMIPSWMGNKTTPFPRDPVAVDPDPNRFNQMGTLVQYCREVEDGRESWLQHKKEASWRLSRLEKQLEAEKARKRREKTEEIEEKIRGLRKEDVGFLWRLESECREKLFCLKREAEIEESKLMENWLSKHVKLVKLVDKIRHFGVGSGVHLGKKAILGLCNVGLALGESSNPLHHLIGLKPHLDGVP
ncbi:hypothetical protein RJ641_023079 [Dillenia turbinata]|uniref:Uncharacterized protein n=1 Tax=Dillenia turbinata TaxID=194707 RepID=A0AAN8UAQ0_9MAGN